MAWSDCVTAVRAAASRALTNDEVADIMGVIEGRIRSKMREGLSARDAASAAGEEMAKEEALKVALAKRDAANNVLRFADLTNRIVEGSEKAVEKRTLDYIDASHHGLRAQLLGPMIQKLHDLEILKLVRSGDKAFDRDLARELFRRDDPAVGKATGNARAEAAARIMGDALEAGRAMQNKAGAWITKLENYMGRQYHDMWKIRAMGYDAWKTLARDTFDLERSYPDATPKEIEVAMKAQYQALQTGVFASHDNAALAGFVGPGNLGKKASQSRSIIFRDADAWLRYNEKAGKGSVADAIWVAADKAAHNTAMMETLGTNPDAMWNKWHERMVRDAVDRGDTTASDALKGDPKAVIHGPMAGMYDVVSGKAAIPQNETYAYIGATIRNIAQFRLGGVAIGPALTHLAIAPAVLRHNGVPLLRAYAATIRSFIPKSAATQEIARASGIGVDGMIGHIINRFRTDDGAPGAMARAVDQYHRLSGFTYMLDAVRAGTGQALMLNLADHAGEAFSALDPKWRSTLSRYGIGEKEWDIARASAQTVAEGRSYLMPREIADPEVASKFHTYVVDQVREGLNDHSPWARSKATFGTQAGTVQGEIVRSLMQFKSFALTLMERQLGRETRRNGFDIPGTIHLMVAMTMMGYAANAIHDLVGNVTPKDPTNPKQAASAFVDAFVRGGAGGLFADVMMGHASSAGDAMKSLAGPVAGAAFDTLLAIKHTAEGPQPSAAHLNTRLKIAEAGGAKVLGNLLPNLFYGKAAYEYLFHGQLQEMADPGARARYDNYLRKQGQSHILGP